MAIYIFLAYASAAQQESALTRHWLTKYLSTAQCDLELLHEHPIFNPVRHETWYKNLIKLRTH